MNTTNFNINIDTSDINIIIDISIERPNTTNYFTKETEDAIIRFNGESDEKRRNVIFESQIYPVFAKLSDCIVNKNHNNVYRESKSCLKNEIITKLFLSMDSFDKSRGKGFSYFNFIAENYTRLHFNFSVSRLKKEIPIIDKDDSEDLEDGISLKDMALAVMPVEDKKAYEDARTKIIKHIKEGLNDKTNVFYRKNRNNIEAVLQILSDDNVTLERRNDLHDSLVKSTGSNSYHISKFLSRLRRDLRKQDLPVTDKSRFDATAYQTEYRKKHKAEAKAYRKDYYKNHKPTNN